MLSVSPDVIGLNSKHNRLIAVSLHSLVFSHGPTLFYWIMKKWKVGYAGKNPDIVKQEGQPV